MAQLAGVRQTYQDTTRREDLLDLIQDVSPDENPLTTILGTSPVHNTLHEWAEYYDARPSSNSKSVEGDDNTFADLTQATRKTNITQIIKEVFAVSETALDVEGIVPMDAYNQEKARAMRKWKRKLEYAVLRGTKASGASAVAREMDGLISVTMQDGLATVRASGTSLGANEIGEMEVASWNVTDSALFDMLLTTGARKRDFANLFSASQNRITTADDRRFTNGVDAIEGNYGQLYEVRAHKDMIATGVLAFRKELVKIGYLGTPKHVQNGVTGDSIKGHIRGEATLEARSARPFVYRSGYQG